MQLLFPVWTFHPTHTDTHERMEIIKVYNYDVYKLNTISSDCFTSLIGGIYAAICRKRHNTAHVYASVWCIHQLLYIPLCCELFGSVTCIC